MAVDLLEKRRLSKAKQSFATRRVRFEASQSLRVRGHTPRSGDVVLAQVTEVGRLKGLQLTTGRKASLYVGDEIIVAYGERYAPDAYEAELPATLGPCHLAAAGGIAGHVLSVNATFAGDCETPTALKPVGVVVNSGGGVVNLADFALGAPPCARAQAPVIAVCGSSMNSGKTTTVASIVRGLSLSGLRVGAAKITGTGSGGDLWKFVDAGADAALDFTDAGMATTYRAPVERVRAGAQVLVGALEAQDVDAIVLEIADGVHQRETAALLVDSHIRALVDHWVYAADTAASVMVGLDVLRRCGIEPAGVAGLITSSPLAMREAAMMTDVSFVSLEALLTGAAPLRWIEPARVVEAAV